MLPSLWQPAVEPSLIEQAIMKRIKRAKLFVFLREHRHQLFDEAFRAANWRGFTSQVRVVSLQFHQPCWPKPPSCKPIQELQMMR